MPRSSELRSSAALGLIAGVILIYLCLVGIVEAFAERNVVTNLFTLGRVMLALPPLVVGYVAAGRLAHRSALACSSRRRSTSATSSFASPPACSTSSPLGRTRRSARS
jgi:uncharacterized membrane protein